MKIGFIGNGWRTQGYWRVVKQVPEKFEISGVLFRNAEKAAAFEADHPGLAFTDLDAFLQQPHDMVFILLKLEVVCLLHLHIFFQKVMNILNYISVVVGNHYLLKQFL